MTCINGWGETTAITFLVDGIPAPQGSKRHVGNGRLIESSKRLQPWRTHVSQVARWSMNCYGLPVLAGPANVAIEFVLHRPKSTPRRSTPPAIKYPDLDKLQRAIFDSIGGIIVANDSQIIDVHATKRLAYIDERPHARITVTAVAP